MYLVNVWRLLHDLYCDYIYTYGKYVYNDNGCVVLCKFNINLTPIEGLVVTFKAILKYCTTFVETILKSHNNNLC